MFILYSVILASKLCFVNLSLKYLTVPEASVIQSTTPLFTYILAYFIENKRSSWAETFCLVGIVGGAGLVSSNVPKFVVMGYVFGFASVLLAAASLNLTSLFKTKLKLNSVDMTFYNAPLCMFSILPFIFVAKEQDIVVDQFKHHPASYVIWLIVGAGMLAFAYNIIRNELCHCSSSVFTSSASNFKVVLTISLGELFVQNTHLSKFQIMGLGLVCGSFFALGYIESLKKVAPKPKSDDEINAAPRKIVVNNEASGKVRTVHDEFLDEDEDDDGISEEKPLLNSIDDEDDLLDETKQEERKAFYEKVLPASYRPHKLSK